MCGIQGYKLTDTNAGSAPIGLDYKSERLTICCRENGDRNERVGSVYSYEQRDNSANSIQFCT